jgi:hypothetical protein
LILRIATMHQISSAKKLKEKSSDKTIYNSTGGNEN